MTLTSKVFLTIPHSCQQDLTKICESKDRGSMKCLSISIHEGERIPYQTRNLFILSFIQMSDQRKNCIHIKLQPLSPPPPTPRTVLGAAHSRPRRRSVSRQGAPRDATSASRRLVALPLPREAAARGHSSRHATALAIVPSPVTAPFPCRTRAGP